MIVKVVKREKIGGWRLEPNTIVQLPDAIADQCIRIGVVERLDKVMETNLGGETLRLSGTAAPPDADVLIRND